MKAFQKFCFLLIVISLFSCSGKNKTFMLVLLPDTQCYTDRYPEIFRSQTSWIADHAGDITFVLQQGDITDHNTPGEWKIAAGAFSLMDGKVPFTFVDGNHDMGDSGRTNSRNTDLMNQFLPYSKYSKQPTFGGVFEKGKMDNTWHTFKAGGYKWLILSLEFGPRTKVLEWAGKVIENHPGYKVIINTHAYLYSDNSRMGSKPGHSGLPQDYPIGKDTLKGDVNNGEQMWQKLVGKYPDVLLVFSGHVVNSGTGRLVSIGIHGNPVYQMLANYQCGVQGTEHGGDGFLREVFINTADSIISVKTWSPYLRQYKTTPDQEFVFRHVEF